MAVQDHVEIQIIRQIPGNGQPMMFCPLQEKWQIKRLTVIGNDHIKVGQSSEKLRQQLGFRGRVFGKVLLGSTVGNGNKPSQNKSSAEGVQSGGFNVGDSNPAFPEILIKKPGMIKFLLVGGNDS